MDHTVSVLWRASVVFIGSVLAVEEEMWHDKNISEVISSHIFSFDNMRMIIISHTLGKSVNTLIQSND